MKQYLTTLFLVLVGLNVFGQNADELNQQAKNFLETQQFDKAVPLIKQSAELGNAEAQYNLGYCFQAGVVVEKNQKRAIEWYLKSADQGFNDALYQLMMAYGNGDGVEQDPKKAFSYALKCAENNDGTCMWNVVNCYYTGMGIEKSIDKMLEWAVRLSKLENPENLAKSGYITSTRLQLAYMYRDGKDIKQDFFKSYLWFLIYNEFKVDFSISQQQQVIKEIQDLENKLTTEQKSNGKKEAEKLLGRPLKNFDNLYKTDL
ncbi:MAG: tetratricopeptide repeat protein [Flavobacteriales bacterium]